MSDLIDVLEGEANISIKWHKNYDMIANPVKFHALWIRKDRSDTSGVNISIQGKSIKSEDSVKFLGTKLENKLNVDSHISDLCNKAVTQLNVLKRLKSFIGLKNERCWVKVLYVFRISIMVRWFGSFHQQSPCKKLK